MAKVTITLIDEGDDNTQVRFIAEFDPPLKRSDITGSRATAAQLLGAMVADYAQEMLNEASDASDSTIDVTTVKSDGGGSDESKRN